MTRLTLVAALLAAVTPAAAQEPIPAPSPEPEPETTPIDHETPPPATSDKDDVEEILVTGSRINGFADGTIKIDSISNQEILERGGHNLSEVLEGEVGLQTTSMLGTGRGIMIDGLDGKYVLVLIDGRPTHGTVDSSLDFSRINIDPDNIERIEIVRGPMSALYGSDALGGVINIITRRPEEYFEASLTFDTRFLPDELDEPSSPIRSSLSTHLSGTVADFALKASASGVWARPYDRHGDGKIDIPGRSHGTLMLEARKEVIEGVEVVTYVEASNVQLDTKVVAALPNSDRTRDLSLAAGAGVETTVGAGHELELDLRIDRFRHLSHRVTRNLSANGRREVETENLRTRAIQDRLRAEIQYRMPTIEHVPILGRIDLTAGITGTFETVEATDQDGVDRLGGEADDGRNAGAVYGELMIRRGIVTIMPGGRFDISTTGSGSDTSARSPKVSVRVDTPWLTSFRASYGEGFRTPDFNERFLEFDHTALGYIVSGNPTLKPERSRGFRLGLESKPLDGISLDVEGYLNLLRNMIDFEETGVNTDGVFLYRYANINRAYTTGVTVSAHARRIVDTLSVTASYQYLIRAVNSSLCPSDDPYFCADVTSLPLRPPHSAHLKISWTAETTGTHLYTHLEYVARRPIDDLESMPAYGILGVGVRQSLGDKLELSLLVDNLLDEYNRIQGPKPGRSIQLGMRASY